MQIGTKVLSILPLVAMVALASCSDSSRTTTALDLEQHANAFARINENAIRARVDGSDLTIRVPVERVVGAAVNGVLNATLVDVTGVEQLVIGTASHQVFQFVENQEYRLTLPNVELGTERAETAGIVIQWRLEMAAGDLYGSRSLYAALGRIEVQLRGPTEIPVGASAPLRVIALDPDSGAPAAGAVITGTLMVDNGDQTTSDYPLFSGTADAEGEYLASVSLPAGIEQGTARVSVSWEESQVWSDTSLRTVYEERVYLSSDKTIYKPGQTISLRALALNPNSRTPLANADVVFEAYDAKGNKVFKSRALTDSFGVASTEVPTDPRVNEGDWTFRVEVAGKKNQIEIPVTRYNLPKMKLELTPEAEYVVPGDLVRVNVQANYLFGEPVVGGAVWMQVTTKSGTYVTSLNGTTDASGALQLEFPMLPGISSAALEEGTERLLIEAGITDTAGQTEDAITGLPLTAGPLVVSVLPESDVVIGGIPNVVYVLVTDPAGRPVVADLTMLGLPGVDVAQTDAQGIAELQFTPASNDALTFSVFAVDGAGRSHSRSIDLGAAGTTSLVVRTDRASYSVGDTATVEILTGGDYRRVYLDLYKGASGMQSQVLSPVNGVATTTVDITSAMRGILVFDAFALSGNGDGQVVHATQRMLVDPEDRLAVTVTPASNSYLPGEMAALQVQVLDANGAPQVASVGLAVVNEASFALGGEPAGNLHTFFNVDPAVLPPEVAVLGRSASDLVALGDATERERLARLLFAAGNQLPGPGFDFNSLNVELPKVRTTLQGALERRVIEAINRLAPMANSGLLDWQNGNEMVVSLLNHTPDPFGRLYRAVAPYQWDNYVEVTSAGPDELFDTRDDVTVNHWYYWLFWGGYTEAMTGGGGGGCWACDFDGAGGPPMAGAADPAPNERSGEPTAGQPGSANARVRSDFRETVLFSPTLITDATGTATVSFGLADSINLWRATAEASTQNGKLGAARGAFRTFQDFFVDFDVPTHLTQGDIIELSAIVYNYTDVPQTVAVTLDAAPWFTNLTGTLQQAVLAPSEVASVRFNVQIDQAGDHLFTLRGAAGGLEDVLQRSASVIPNGFKDDQSFSDKLNGTTSHTISVPADAIDGGTRVTLTLTPGFAAEAVRGTEGLMHEPNGCFEQTTSSAWPNTLVTNYLEDTGQMTPELREQAVAMVIRGYQRLLTFESPTGGYNWWGDNTPGNRLLSAIMLWHLKDLESLIEIDYAVRDRTLDWLLAQQNADGSWEAGDALHAGNEVLGTSKVRTTAFIAWGLKHTGWADAAVDRAAGWLRSNLPDATDLYANALAANALAMADPSGAATDTLLARLDNLKEIRPDNRVLWPTEQATWTGASGDIGALETTGLVAYGLMQARAYPENAAQALRFIIANKDSVGTWYNTQATMNALRALSAAASPQGSDAEGTFTISVNGTLAATELVTLDTGDVYRTIDITDFIAAGDNIVDLEMVGTGELSYQLSRTAYRPASAVPATALLELDVSYDNTTTTVGAPITATILATNRDVGVRDQVMVRVGKAPGFVPRVEDLELLVSNGQISRFEVDGEFITLYMMGLGGGESRSMAVRLTPSLAGEVAAQPSVIYAYYEPTLRQTLDPQLFTVLAP